MVENTQPICEQNICDENNYSAKYLVGSWQAILPKELHVFLKQIVKLHLVWSSLELTFCWIYVSPHLFMSSIKSNQLPFVKFKHNKVSISSHIVMLAATKVNGEVF